MLAGLKSSIGEKDNSLAKLNSKISSSEYLIDDMEAQLAEQNESLSALRARFDKQEKAYEALDQKIKSERAQLKKLRRAEKQSAGIIETLELHRMILAGMLILAIILAAVGFFRKPKAA